MDRICRISAILLLLCGVAGCAGTAESAPKPAEGSSEVAARVGDREITVEELDEKAREADVSAYQALYDARSKVLKSMVEQQLLANEAAKRGITTDALVQEVVGKVPPVTEADVLAFYEENKAGMRGQTLDQLRGRIQQHLTDLGRGRAMNELITSISLKTDVQLMLEPPRVNVTVAANDPVKGPAGAPVQILEFSDFQ